MTQRIYVGNLPFSATEGELSELFAQYGEVVSCSLPKDRETGRPRGFGFVEMETDEGLQAAVAALNGYEMNGRPLTVNEARERTPRPGGGGGGSGMGRRFGGRCVCAEATQTDARSTARTILRMGGTS